VNSSDPDDTRKKLFEQIQKMNDLRLAVGKNHIMLEGFMNEFLVASRKKHKDLTFAEKAALCQELKPAIDAPIWEVVTAVNKLRNKIAHKLDHVEIQTKMDELRTAYLAALPPTQAKGIQTLDDVKLAASACEHCGAYLAAATDAAKTAKRT
jgi:hypothetical protein